MQLTKKQWIAVVIAILVIVIFFGARLLTSTKTQEVSVSIDQNTLNAEQIATSTNSNKVNNLIIKDVVVGTGAEAKNGNLVSVQYTGKFADGKVFDSSIPRGEPIRFVLGEGQVIRGWDQGILGMKVGGKRTLTIPPELGYGASGFPPVIPANSTLYFDVELVGVQVR